MANLSGIFGVFPFYLTSLELYALLIMRTSYAGCMEWRNSARWCVLFHFGTGRFTKRMVQEKTTGSSPLLQLQRGDTLRVAAVRSAEVRFSFIALFVEHSVKQ